MLKRNPELKLAPEFSNSKRFSTSVDSFHESMLALGEAAGHPSSRTIERQAKRERLREVCLVAADLALQPLVEVKQAREEMESQRFEAESRLSIDDIQDLSGQGIGVIVHPFKR